MRWRALARGHGRRRWAEQEGAIEQTIPDELVALGWKEIGGKAFYRSIGPLYARRIAEREWEYGLQTTEQHDNGTGAVHGGVLATFLDQALSTVAWTAAGRRPASTVSLDLQFANAVRPGSFLVARGTVVRAGKSLIFLTGLISCGTDDVVSGSGIWRVAPNRAATA